MLFKEEMLYRNILNDILTNGSKHEDRTKVGTLAVFGKTMEFDLTDGKIPLLSTRQVPIRFMPIELQWFISGDTNIKFLLNNNVNIWNSWVIPSTAVYDTDPQNFLKNLDAQGVIKLDDNYKEVFKHLDSSVVNSTVAMLTGKPVPEKRLLSGSIGDGAYGAQWRKWEDIRSIKEEELPVYLNNNYKEVARHQVNIEDKLPVFNHDTLEITSWTIITDVEQRVLVQKKIDQLQDAIDLIKHNPNSRRIIVSAWNVGRLDQMSLPACHSLFQFNVRESNGVKYLTCNLYCRSQDFLVGTVANIAQYAMLTHMVAQVTGCVAERLVWFGSNVHVYANQVELAKDHLDRMPLKNQIKLELNKDIKNIDDFTFEDIKITGYDNYLPAIKYPVAV